ncbi:hypothetical protein OEA41_010627 [Lepraria neglecta]|uniref:Mok11-13/Ags1-like Ig-like beta-sandwich domain-containing protein n=1 Tax=Lepraria neglecta TaxID=209136 RepID=A0AAE0DFR2_9LECA|nr:hypothetical protein OEA41_010627 [Lepraria neglecta]
MYSFDCFGDLTGLLVPFDKGSTVKTLFYLYDEVTLGSVTTIGYYRLPVQGEQQDVSIELYFSDEMDCNQLRNAISVTSTTETEIAPSFQNAVCENVNDTTARVSEYTGPVTNQIPAVWKISGNPVNVSDGVHLVDIVNVTNQAGNASTNAVNHFLLCIGQIDNPMVFTRTANYSNSLLYENADKSFMVWNQKPRVVLQGKKDYKLQSVEPFFTDPTGLYYNAFEKKLKKLNGKLSEGTLYVKMGKSAESTPASSVFRLTLTRHDSAGSANSATLDAVDDAEYNRAEQYLLNEDYKPPTGVKRILLMRIGQWFIRSYSHS